MLNQPQNQPALKAPTTNTHLLSDSVTNLAQRIARAISNQKSKTEIFSPVSIAGALSLLLLGSGGQTQQELLAVMGLNKGQLSFQEIHIGFGRLFQDLVSNDPSLEPLVTWRLNDKCNRVEEDEYDDEFTPAQSPSNTTEIPPDYDPAAHEISLANGIFVLRDFPLSESYRNRSMVLYNSEVQPMDFELDAVGSTKKINGWVSEKTHGKIPNILPSTLSPNTVMVLASAMYFRALWAETFIDGATKPREFFPNGHNHPPVMVDMMAHGGCFPFYESPELDARIIGLPYKNNLTTMYVIMPNNSTRAKLQALIARMSGDNLQQMIDRMKIKTSIILFPKMHISNSMDLKRVLQTLGSRSLFRADQSNLSGMMESGASSPPEQYVNRLQGATLSPQMEPRPTVNIPPYVPKPAMGSVPDLANQLVFSRHDNDEDMMMKTTTNEPMESTVEGSSPMPTNIPGTMLPLVRNRSKRDVSYKVPSSRHVQTGPLSSKDFILNKRIVKENGSVGKKSFRRRSKRDAQQQLYVSDAVHEVDLEINETGTEGGAATVVTLNRSGTSVVFRAEAPFLVVIRNDRTRLPLFYGAIYDPRS
ncbi:serine protease inhibitor 28Dc-like [Anopheles nili]|uniref:serine protease inhibitor 28Dc-like n=1 Tax=Anopheles nili TaxID=185578 RepID=UPI00237B58A6|nr:serine protease inhibitor 28Dc-like [Anopheles nili]